MSDLSTGGARQPGRWEIRVMGHLDQRWAAWFDGLSPTRENDGTLLIRGPALDQAPLRGLLTKLRDVGLPPICITRADRPDTPTTEPRCPTTSPKDMDMAPTARPTTTTRAPMGSPRRTALLAGIFYLITFVSIPTLALYGPVKSQTDFILSSGTDTAVLWGAFLEVVVALACIATAVTLYPVLRHQNEGMALGFVAARTLEAAMIFTGVASLLSLVSLRNAGATGAQAAALLVAGASHVATYQWAFTLGQSLMPGINALLLGAVLYRAGLVPRAIPVIGLLGAPLHLTAVLLTMFGVIDRLGPVAALAALPIAVWEFSLGVHLIVKGFTPSPITAATIEAGAVETAGASALHARVSS